MRDLHFCALPEYFFRISHFLFFLVFLVARTLVFRTEFRPFSEKYNVLVLYPNVDKNAPHQTQRYFRTISPRSFVAGLPEGLTRLKWGSEQKCPISSWKLFEILNETSKNLPIRPFIFVSIPVWLNAVRLDYCDIQFILLETSFSDGKYDEFRSETFNSLDIRKKRTFWEHCIFSLLTKLPLESRATWVGLVFVLIGSFAWNWLVPSVGAKNEVEINVRKSDVFVHFPQVVPRHL